MYDEACLGEASDFSELAKYLSSYDNSNFIGCEDEESWKQAVLQEVPNLFSLGYDTTNVKTIQTHTHAHSSHTCADTHAHIQTHVHSTHMYTYIHMHYHVLNTCI